MRRLPAFFFVLLSIALLGCSAPRGRSGGAEGGAGGGGVGAAGAQGGGGEANEGTDDAPPNEGGDEGASDFDPNDAEGQGEGGDEGAPDEGGDEGGADESGEEGVDEGGADEGGAGDEGGADEGGDDGGPEGGEGDEGDELGPEGDEGDEGGEGVDPNCEPHREVCDGRDNDCDREVDEDDPVMGDACDTGLSGPCWQGRRRCIEGGMECVGVVDATEEVCDGVDNDCDGEFDEGRPESNVECEAEIPGECGFGLTRCEDGFLWCDGLDPSAELCDGRDNDCDGEVDEREDDLEGGPGDGQPCETGEEGVCALGVGVCEDAQFTCEQLELPSDEVCDGQDNDCDGDVDEDDGQGECVRDNVLLCTRASRDVREFFPEGAVLNLANGCVPDEDTQAMLIARSGNAAFQGAAVRQYIEAGGIVITEYSGSHIIYNSIVGGNHQQGRRNGECYDNIPVAWRDNLEDPFWIANPPPGDAGRTGCGYSIDHLPDLVLLAGWSANNAAVGYLQLGAGRLWIVDVDWQDSQRDQSPFTKQMMGYMILNR